MRREMTFSLVFNQITNIVVRQGRRVVSVLSQCVFPLNASQPRDRHIVVGSVTLTENIDLLIEAPFELSSSTSPHVSGENNIVATDS